MMALAKRWASSATDHEAMAGSASMPSDPALIPDIELRIIGCMWKHLGGELHDEALALSKSVLSAIPDDAWSSALLGVLASALRSTVTLGAAFEDAEVWSGATLRALRLGRDRGYSVADILGAKELAERNAPPPKMASGWLRAWIGAQQRKQASDAILEAERARRRGEDPAAILVNIIDPAAEKARRIGSGLNADVSSLAAVKAYIKREEARERGDVPTALPSRWDRVNRVIGGGYRVGLTLVGARPGLGKSTFVEQEIAHLVRQGMRCAIVSLEMEVEDIIDRMSNRECGFPPGHTGKTEEQSARHLAWLAEWTRARVGMQCLNDTNKSPAEIFAALDRMVEHAGGDLDVCALDHFHAANPDVKLHGSMPAACDAFAKDLSDWAKRHRTLVFVPVQFSTEVDKARRRPVDADIAYGPMLRREAINIILIHEHDMKDAAPGDADRTGIIPKARWGTAGDVKLWWDGTVTGFRDLPLANPRAFNPEHIDAEVQRQESRGMW